MPAKTQNAAQQVLIKPIPCQRVEKGISTIVNQAPPMPERTQNASQHVLTKFISRLPLQEMNL
jgi:hypothetical protein